MSRREFLKNVGTAAAAGSLLGVSQTTSAQGEKPKVGYFEEPGGTLQARLNRPWELTEEDWDSVVNRVRAGRQLKPAAWPGGARFAVALSFDCDHEVSSLAGGNTAPGALAGGQRGRRVGVPRILEVLDAQAVPATFYTPAVVALMDKPQTREIVRGGHEVGMHGWIHANNSRLDRATERELMRRAREVLEDVTGEKVVGHRSPNFDLSANTIELVAEMGLEYDSSLMADDSCYELLMNGENTGDLVEVPVEWVRDDAVYLSFNRTSARPLLSPDDVFGIFRRELEAAAAEGDVFQLLMHPHIIGHRSRIWIIDELIKHARGLGGAWFGTHAQVARWARENAV